METFRVSVRQVGGEEIAMETFMAKSDAEAFANGFFAEGSILEGMAGAYTVTSEELVEGMWIVRYRKLVRA